MIELFYKDGTQAERGDLIRWGAWDNDDNIEWTFTGLYLDTKVIYLGGGIDFGLGIGQEFTIVTVIDQSEFSDCPGIEKVGVAMDAVRAIKAI